MCAEHLVGARALEASVRRVIVREHGDLFQRQPERFQRDDPFELPEIANGVAAVAGARTLWCEQAVTLVMTQRLDGDACELGKGADRVAHATSLRSAPGAESTRLRALRFVAPKDRP